MEARKELDRKLEITTIKKKPVKQTRDPISFNKMIEYLKTDNRIEIQNSYYPAEKLIYQQTRKKQLPESNHLLSTFDLREIMYKANDYNV